MLLPPRTAPCLSMLVAMVALGTLPVLAEPATPAPTAAQLVQGVIDQENKIHDFPSLRIQIKSQGRLTPRVLAEAQAARDKGLPGIDPTPRWSGECELIFDAQRISTRSDTEKHIMRTAWNGKAAKSFTRDKSTPVGSGGLASKFDGTHVFGCLDWLKVGAHEFWWTRKNAAAQESPPQPTEFELVGQEAFRGEPCYRIECARASLRLFVSTADRRLRGFVELYPLPEPEELALANRVAGTKLTTAQQLADWMAKLAEDERQKFQATCARQRMSLPRAYSEWYFNEYAEMTPGFWMPRHCGVDLVGIDGNETYPATFAEMELVAFDVKPQLTDEQFDIDFPQGTKIWDTRYDPPLYYSYKKHFSDKEWAAILNAKKQELAEAQQQKALQELRIGQAAPELPAKAAWFNSAPLDWSDLKGKLVLLEFFSEGCGPCRNHLPTLAQIHKDREDSGIVVLGLHSIGSEPADVKAFVEKQQIEYPICVDPDDSDGRSFGPLYRWFAVDAIPHTALVDRQGKVVATGKLEEVLKKAQALAAEPK